MGASDNNWTVPTDLGTYLDQQARRQGQEERRPQIRKASDLLGPGFAPFAVPVDDLDDDVAAFNGLFITAPGAANTPDITKWWVGETIATQANGGTQTFSTFRALDAPHITMMRGFEVAPDSSQRFYSAWQEMGGGGDPVVRYEPVEVFPISPFTSGVVVLTRVGDVVYCTGSIVRATGSSTSWTPALQAIPVGLRPAIDYVTPAMVVFNATHNAWQGNIFAATGVTEIRMLNPTSSGMSFGAFQWVTNDDPSGLTPV